MIDGTRDRMPFHFVDSGAHSLINQLHKTKGESGKLDFSAYKKPEFWQYVDDYCAFIKQYAPAIDFYANVDVIRNPKMSWKVQRYMEQEHGLKPIPVVHFNCPLRWLEKYLNAGYDYIALGGRVGKLPYTPWADRAWNMICDTPGRLPQVKVHGFSVTTHKLIVRYPWWSVDSTTWRKMAYQGQVLLPPRVNGKFRFDIPNRVLFMDPTSKYTKAGNGRGRHFVNQSPTLKREIRDWFKELGIPFGKRRNGVIVREGVTNSERWRQAATIQYYLHLRDSLPDWPWAFWLTGRIPLMERIKRES